MSEIQPGTWLVSLPGQPIPWRRARRNGNRYFTDDAVAERQRAWKFAWRLRFGHRQIPHGPIEVVGARFYSQRPASHWTTKGQLSAAGRRSLWPDLDVDNALKLVLDALNKTAYHDDKQVRMISNVASLWLPDREGEPCTLLVLRELDADALQRLAVELPEQLREQWKR